MPDPGSYGSLGLVFPVVFWDFLAAGLAATERLMGGSRLSRLPSFHRGDEGNVANGLRSLTIKGTRDLLRDSSKYDGSINGQE